MSAKTTEKRHARRMARRYGYRLRKCAPPAEAPYRYERCPFCGESRMRSGVRVRPGDDEAAFTPAKVVWRCLAGCSSEAHFCETCGAGSHDRPTTHTLLMWDAIHATKCDTAEGQLARTVYGEFEHRPMIGPCVDRPWSSAEHIRHAAHVALAVNERASRPGLAKLVAVAATLARGQRAEPWELRAALLHGGLTGRDDGTYDWRTGKNLQALPPDPAASTLVCALLMPTISAQKYPNPAGAGRLVAAYAQAAVRLATPVLDRMVLAECAVNALAGTWARGVSVPRDRLDAAVAAWAAGHPKVGQEIVERFARERRAVRSV